MKALIASAIILFSGIFAYSQNQGQSPENGSIRISYAGYTSGNYVINVYNKKNVSVDVEMDWLSEDTVIYSIPSLTTVVVQLPGDAVNNTKIKAKLLTHTSDPDMGWVEVSSPQNLGATGWEETYRVWTDDNNVNFSWTTYIEDKCGYFRIDKSLDGKEWTTYAMINTKAKNGNSNMPIAYSYSCAKKKTNLAAFGACMFFGLVILALGNKRLMPLTVCVVLLGSISCSRSGVLEDMGKQAVQFRITQVDDNNSTYTTGPTKMVKI